jgi:hypothetical protein
MDFDIFWKNDTGWASGGPDIGLKGPLPTVPVETTLKGDGANPLTTVSTLKGDGANPLTTVVTGDPNHPVTTLVLGDTSKPVPILLEGNPQSPISIAITQLPEIKLSTDIGLKPTRIHNPAHFTFCISLLGINFVTFDLCGEAMTVIEPYHPHKTEICA